MPLPSRTSQILKTILYLLAGLVLIMGLITGINLIATANKLVVSFIQPLQLIGGGAFFNLIAPMLTGFLINLGVSILILTLIISLLLYAHGRLTGHNALLEARLVHLETRFQEIYESLDEGKPGE